MGICLGYENKFEGNVSLRERVENAKETKPFGYKSNYLVQVDELVNLNIDYNEDEGLRISLTAYHVENSSTDRVFHADLKAFLNIDEIQKVIKLLEMCVEIGSSKKGNEG